MSSLVIVCDDYFSSVVDMIKEAIQLHRNFKRCIFILLSTLIAFFCTALADMITGYGIITPMLAAVLTAAVIPLCCTGFRNVKSDIKGNMTPSGFISQGKPDKKFFIRSAVCGLICGAISALFLTLAGGVMSAQQVSSVMLTLLTVMTGAMCLVVTDKRTGAFKNGAIPKYMTVTAAATSVTSILLPYIPFINSLFGFAVPNPLASIAAVLAGVALPAGLQIKKYLNK